jgi:hypothetical protein
LPVDMTVIFDPELVVPAEANKLSLEFWARLGDWICDPRPRLGQDTLEGLNQLISNPLDVQGMPRAEFWKIVSQLASRGYAREDDSRLICEKHLREDYRYVFGGARNVELLVTDVTAVGPGPGVVLATDQQSWPLESPLRNCTGCGAQRIYLLKSPNADYAQASRSEFLRSRPSNAAAIQDLAFQLFPNVTFSDSAWTRLNTLTGDPREIVKNLVLHLGVLNDHASATWEAANNTNQRQQHLRSHGVEASPESPQTHKSTKAMRERTFDFGGRAVVCEWHTKLKPHLDRVYFAVAGNRVYVGAIVDHLAT